MAQGRQNTNYGINLYACHPFFIQGVATMTNGENTAFVPIKEWLEGKNIPGYMGYQSDSEVFAHILIGRIKEMFSHQHLAPMAKMRFSQEFADFDALIRIILDHDAAIAQDQFFQRRLELLGAHF